MVVIAAWISLSSETYTSSKVSSILCLKIIQEIMPFAATWMDLAMIMLSQKEKDKYHYDITYIWNLKYDINEFIYEIESNSQT